MIDIPDILLIVSGWTVFEVALIASICNFWYVWRHRRDRKTFLRVFEGIVSLYLAVVYAVITLGCLSISEFSAILGRVGVFLVLVLLVSDTIVDMR